MICNGTLNCSTLNSCQYKKQWCYASTSIRKYNMACFNVLWYIVNVSWYIHKMPCDIFLRTRLINRKYYYAVRFPFHAYLIKQLFILKCWDEFFLIVYLNIVHKKYTYLKMCMYVMYSVYCINSQPCKYSSFHII